MPNFLSHDEQCIRVLLERLGKDDPRYVDVLTLQDELRENRRNVGTLGESENLRNDWARIRKSLNLIALEATGRGLDDLYPPPKQAPAVPPPAADPVPVVSHPIPPDYAASIPTLPCCPFVAGPKITDPRLFVGRKMELHRLVSALEGVQPISINVVGERRIGKSSLLYHFFQTWEQRVRDPRPYVVAYLSLQEAAAQQEADFYHAAAEALLARPGMQRFPDLTAALSRSTLTRVDFAAAMRQCQMRDLLPVLCLDEFEALLKYPQRFDDGFYDALRALMDDGALMLVVASQNPLDVYRRRQRLTSSFFNLGHVLQLTELTEDEAADLVRLPASTVTGAQATLSLDEQHLAREWGGRHPCKLQLAASFLCQARQEGRDAAWASAQFLTQARRLPRNGVPLRRLLQSLRWLVWDLPVRLGRLAKSVGGTMDEVTAWLMGMAVVILVLLVVLGIVNRAQLWEWVCGVLGG